MRAKKLEIKGQTAYYIDSNFNKCYSCLYFFKRGIESMEHIKTVETRNLCESAKNGGCGECQTSCQSACKTSCGIANQKCENENK